MRLVAYVLANWKMYPRPAAAGALVARVQDRLREQARLPTAVPIVIVCPPAIALTAIRAMTEPPLVRLGAQNCHWEPSGPSHVRTVVARVKERLREMGARRPAIIYGGSVTADNVGRSQRSTCSTAWAPRGRRWMHASL